MQVGQYCEGDGVGDVFLFHFCSIDKVSQWTFIVCYLLVLFLQCSVQ